ncbi:MAG: 4-oxalocrotonate tautomerase family protein [Desulfarculaceae bacterium]|nr:4-oxalocrotonate tautomerase family protein [Desulfarculaceae bacterium]MCF8072082.1 4-oxalocrotonate tautomerase family protein [Desulfarculaceae bacterium]MCF8101599.1 4-oxalocrotonate tautomerase family protein [Desulfarculaceae bacterium]MCF8115149.1 4-oxalocrotonate tautomerase family protein [Desulfarculaceae bacterium]
MPYVNVKIAGTATTEQKQQLMADITEVLYKVLNKPHKATYVVIDEYDTNNWGVGGESLTVRRARQNS